MRFALKQRVAKERKRSCLREEIRGHLRVRHNRDSWKKLKRKKLNTRQRLIGKEALLPGKYEPGSGHNEFFEIHISNSACSSDSDMTVSLHSIFTQAQILFNSP